MCKAIVIHFLINTYFCENTLGQIVVGVDVQVAVGARVVVVDIEAARDAVAVLYACAGFVEYDDVLEGVVADGDGFNRCIYTQEDARLVLGGDVPIMVTKNSHGNGKKIAVLKESYGNAFSPFISYTYSETHLIDFRYAKIDLKSYLEKNGITDVIIINNSMASATPDRLDELRSIAGGSTVTVTTDESTDETTDTTTDDDVTYVDETVDDDNDEEYNNYNNDDYDDNDYDDYGYDDTDYENYDE